MNLEAIKSHFPHDPYHRPHLAANPWFEISSDGDCDLSYTGLIALGDGDISRGEISDVVGVLAYATERDASTTGYVPDDHID